MAPMARPEPTFLRVVAPAGDKDLADAVASEGDALRKHRWFTYGEQTAVGSWSLLVEGDVHYCGRRVAVSRGGVLSYQLMFDEPILSVAWCKFDGMTQAVLCVALKRSLRVHGPGGARYEVGLPVNVARMWSLGDALLFAREIDAAERQVGDPAIPTLFSLQHPLEHLRPVVIAPSIEMNEPSIVNVHQEVVGVVKHPRLVVMRDDRDGRLSAWEWTCKPAETVAKEPKPDEPAVPATPEKNRRKSSAVGDRSMSLATSLASMPFPSTPADRRDVLLPSPARFSSPVRRSGAPPVTASAPRIIGPIDMDASPPASPATGLATPSPDSFAASRSRRATASPAALAAGLGSTASPHMSVDAAGDDDAPRPTDDAKRHRVNDQPIEAALYLRLLAASVGDASYDLFSVNAVDAVGAGERVFVAHNVAGRPVLCVRLKDKLSLLPLREDGSRDARIAMARAAAPSHDGDRDPLALFEELTRLFSWVADAPFYLEEVMDAASVVCTRGWASDERTALYDLIVVRADGRLQIMAGAFSEATAIEVALPPSSGAAGAIGSDDDHMMFTPAKRPRHGGELHASPRVGMDDDGEDEMDMDMSMDESVAGRVSSPTMMEPRATSTPSLDRTATPQRMIGSSSARVIAVSFAVGPHLTISTAEAGLARYSFLFAPRNVLVRQCFDALRYVLPPTTWCELLVLFHAVPSARRLADEWSAFLAALAALFSRGAGDVTPSGDRNRPATSEAWFGTLAEARRLFPHDVLAEAFAGALDDRRLLSPGKSQLSRTSYGPYLIGMLSPVGASIDLVPAVLLALHLVYEESKLDVHLSGARTAMNRTILLPIARFVGWADWVEAYVRDCPAVVAPTALNRTIDVYRDKAIDMSAWPPIVPTLIERAPNANHFSLINLLLTMLEEEDATTRPPFPSLAALSSLVGHVITWIPPTELGVTLPEVCMRTNSVLRAVRLVAEQRPLDAIEALHSDGWSRTDIDALPLGLSMHICQCMHAAREAPPASWSAPLLRMIGREDLARQAEESHVPPAWMRPSPSLPQLKEVIDTHISCGNLISLKFETDLRFIEAQRLLSATRTRRLPRVVGQVNDHETQEKLKEDLVPLLRRSLAMAVGRGAMTLEAFNPSSQEPFVVHEPTTHGQTTARTTVNVDPSWLSGVTAWCEFHNGVAAALRIPRNHAGIDQAWIAAHMTPQRTTNAGMYFGLGLAGHLKALNRVYIRKLFELADTQTIIGVILGLCAMHVGDMDPATSHILYTHIPALLPEYAAELPTPPLVKTAALMGLGLVYLGSKHRHITEMLCGELARSGELVRGMTSLTMTDSMDAAGWTTLSECYAFTAGTAIGLINLGHGGAEQLPLLHVLSQLALGRGTYGRGTFAAYDGVGTFAPHITSFGVISALALTFMRTNDERALACLPLPGTPAGINDVTPEQLMVRVLARAMIEWDGIEPSMEWVRASVPAWMNGALSTTLNGDTPLDELRQADGLAHDYADRWYYSILAGRVHAIGLRFAGTGHALAAETAIHIIEWALDKHSKASTALDRRRDVPLITNVLSSAGIALGLIMAGTGDLAALKALRRLHNLARAGIPFGFYLAAHMAIGFLFLGATRFSFGTDIRSTAMLFISTFPIWPLITTDNRYHLQPYRHFYHLAAQNRGLITCDAQSMELCPVPVTVRLNSGEVLHLRTPCLLPELSSVNTVVLSGERHWERAFSSSDPVHRLLLRGSQVIYVKRRSGVNDYRDDPTGSLALKSRIVLPELPSVDVGIGPTQPLTGLTEQALVALATDEPFAAGIFGHVSAAQSEARAPRTFGAFVRLATLMCVACDCTEAIAPLVALFRLAQTATSEAVVAGQFARLLPRQGRVLFPPQLVLYLTEDVQAATLSRAEAECADGVAARMGTWPQLPTSDCSEQLAAVLVHRHVPLPSVLAEAIKAAAPGDQHDAVRQALVLMHLVNADARPLPRARDVQWLLRREREAARR